MNNLFLINGSLPSKLSSNLLYMSSDLFLFPPHSMASHLLSCLVIPLLLLSLGFGNSELLTFNLLNDIRIIHVAFMFSQLASVVWDSLNRLPYNPYASNWTERLRKIRKIREVLLKDINDKSKGQKPMKLIDFTDLTDVTVRRTNRIESNEHWIYYID